jgi:triosephosphate isomerase
MHYADHGAFTGEVSPPMLVAVGARWVILGHSERRAYSGETDAAINKKIPAALAHGITPIVAVGETLEEHEAGLAISRVVSQIQAAFAGIAEADVARCVVAYEPIWAIGTGKVDSPTNANATMGAIRAAVAGLESTRLLYGGSAKADNIGALVAQRHIDGALVGGASLDPKSFAALLQNARKGVAA